MILQASKYITATLADARISALTQNVNWELAEQNAKPPFINFTVSDSGPGTKDRFGAVECEIRAFGNSITQSAEIIEVVREVAKEQGWKDRGATSGYTDTQAKEGFVQVNFNFNLKSE